MSGRWKRGLFMSDDLAAKSAAVTHGIHATPYCVLHSLSTQRPCTVWRILPWFEDPELQRGGGYAPLQTAVNTNFIATFCELLRPARRRNLRVRDQYKNVRYCAE